ncbi:MAG: tRNA (adenosine(37)-N6)-threonylcarbamoyltransferase complex ATPase subunit type 1 TsaE [Dehalococcoidia bacterium]
MDTLQVTTATPEETQRLGRALGEALEGCEALLMTGELGAGKTCLTQGIAWGLGVGEYARSPTFVLISEYQGRMTLYHIDLYRLDDIKEMEDLGLEEYFERGGVCVVEWAEKAAPILPPENLAIKIDVDGVNNRTITLEARGQRHQALLDRLSASFSAPGSGVTGG